MPERGEKRVDTFAEYHPLINFIYFVMVIGIAMFYMHPVLLGLSLAGSLAYSIYLKGRKTVKVFLFGMLPACLLMMVINPLFSHEGATMLFYLKDGNPVTLESILYGVGSGIMLACVVSWFSVFHAVMTSDKFMYLFGKVIPAFSLLLSMCLRFVPRFTGQIKKVAQAQQCIGRNVNNGKVWARAAHGLKILSVTTTWALENSVETADSMKSRAYGLRGRTNFSIYRFDRRDAGLLGFLAGVFVLLMAGIISRKIHILYFPVFIMNALTPAAVLVYSLYGLLCVLPLLLNIAEDIKWRSLRSKI